MTRHTLDEYKAALHQHTGLMLDVRVYADLQPETLGLWQQDIEVAHVADVRDLSALPAQLPPQLLRTQEDVQQRIKVIEALQNPYLFERILDASPHFLSLLEAAASTLDQNITPLTIVRHMRDRIARIVWEANPLFLRQLQQIVQDENH